MNISYPMIAKVCSDNDKLCERGGLAAAFKDLDISLDHGINLTMQGALLFLYTEVRHETPKGRWVPSRTPIVTDEQSLWHLFMKTWQESFLVGVNMQKSLTTGEAVQRSMEGIDEGDLETAAQQRVMRIISLIVRREQTKPGVFALREGSIVLQEEDLVVKIRATYLDGFVAGMGSQKKRESV